MATLTPKTFVYGHRGASGYAPENTLEAFAIAAEMKADGVELDVHFSKDGQVVVIHDDKIDRVSNGQGKVKEYTLEELHEKGINDSIIHVDFMIGTEDLDITAETFDGKTVQIFKNGNWAF